MDKINKRSSRTTAEQHKIMLDYFCTNQGLAEGRFATMHGRQEAGRKWEELASLLNNVKGAQKTETQWQVTWRDLKSRTSVKARERRKEMAKTGGNPLTLPALTEVEMRILHLLGQNYTEGSSLCPESFPEEEHLQILLECGDNDVLEQCPTVANVGTINDTGEAAGGDEENWPVDRLDDTVEEAARVQPSRSAPKRVPKRTERNLARDQFAAIAKNQAEAITMQAESALKQAEASELMAEAAIRIANALERLATSFEQLVVKK